MVGTVRGFSPWILKRVNGVNCSGAWASRPSVGWFLRGSFELGATRCELVLVGFELVGWGFELANWGFELANWDFELARWDLEWASRGRWDSAVGVLVATAQVLRQIQFRNTNMFINSNESCDLIE